MYFPFVEVLCVFNSIETATFLTRALWNTRKRRISLLVQIQFVEITRKSLPHFTIYSKNSKDLKRCGGCEKSYGTVANNSMAKMGLVSRSRLCCPRLQKIR